MRRAGFTLLEVVIALAILAIGLTVLVSSQSQAVVMATETDNIRVATLLAQEKMNEALVRVETDGFVEGQDIEEEGDFKDFGAEDFRGTEGLDLELGDRLDDFQWAYTIREIEFELPDLGGAVDTLGANGFFGQQQGAEDQQQNVAPNISQDMLGSFLSPDMITQQLSPYMREVRVLVWWGKDEDETDRVELLTHVINPTGETQTPEDDE